MCGNCEVLKPIITKLTFFIDTVDIKLAYEFHNMRVIVFAFSRFIYSVKNEVSLIYSYSNVLNLRVFNIFTIILTV